MSKNGNKYNWKYFTFRIREPLLYIILFISLYAFNTYVVRFAIVSGNSMYPTLMDRDILLVNQINYKPSTGDVILINVSESQLPEKYIVKRVIAVGEDTVSLDYENNSVYVNGTKVSEPYLNFDQSDPMMAVDNVNSISYQLPSGTIFVMGDNRNDSIDSRNEILGMIEQTDIVGKVCLNFSLFQYFN